MVREPDVDLTASDIILKVFALGYIVSVLLCIMRYGGGRHAILLKDPVKFAQVSASCRHHREHT